MVSRILFVGDYDLAGGGIATRMYREGCKVSWLTSNRDKMLWGDRVHGKVHRLAITYNNCSQIIKGEAVDCIVVLTGIYRELDDQDAVWGRGTLLPMLVPVLRAAAAEQVRYICFLSSVRLGDEGLLEPGFEELRAGERIVTSFCQEKKIPLLVLRLDCVYGQRMLDGPNLVGDILRAMQKGKDAACPFTPDSEFDILFKWDMADAAYRLLNMDASGSFQVLTGSPVTARQLWEMAAAALGHEGTIQYGQKERHCPQGWDQEIRQLCGWMPFYPFAEHGAAIMERELARWRQDGAAAQKKTDWKTRLKKKPFLYETAQNLLLFGITVLLTRFTVSWSDLRFVDVRLLYVVIIAITFGMRQGLLATGLAIVSYTGSLLRSGVDVSYMLYSIESWVPLIVYGVAGAFGGYWSDRKHDEYQNLENEFQENKSRYQLLKDLYREVLDVKNRLQKQIVISKDSFNRIYTITEGLDRQNPYIVLLRTVGVIEEVMECGAVAIYLQPRPDSPYCRLMACSSSLASRLRPSMDLRTMPKLQQAIQKGEMFVNLELEQSCPVFAMPVSDGQTSVALVELYDLSADQYTVYYRSLFQTLVQIVQNNLIHAYRYQKENWSRLHLPGTSIMKAEAFTEQLTALRQASEEYGYSYSVARIELSGDAPLPPPKEEAVRPSPQPDAGSDVDSLYQQLLRQIDTARERPARPVPRARQPKPAARTLAQTPVQELYRRIQPLLRGTDLLGMGEDGGLRAVFLYLDAGHRPLLESRFAGQGFRLVWEG